MARDDPNAFLFQPLEAEAERRAEMRARRKTRVQPSQQCRKRTRAKRPPGDRYTPGSYRQAIAKARDRAFPCPEGQDLAAWQKSHRWHPHQLRHSLATRVRREFGLDTARAILKHTSVVTSATYAELDQAKASQAMGKIG